MELRITQERETVATVEDYDGPIPRAGEYIYHRNGSNVMQVRAVTWALIGPAGEPPGPYVELAV